MATPRLTPKQEDFCKTYVETNNASEAYRRHFRVTANESTVWNAACKMLKKPQIEARVAELRKVAAKRHDVSVDSLVEELEEARELAKQMENPTAMVAATMGKAKLLGFEGKGKDTSDSLLNVLSQLIEKLPD